jgi:hypothetical protein
LCKFLQQLTQLLLEKGKTMRNQEIHAYMKSYLELNGFVYSSVQFQPSPGIFYQRKSDLKFYFLPLYSENDFLETLLKQNKELSFKINLIGE